MNEVRITPRQLQAAYGQYVTDLRDGRVLAVIVTAHGRDRAVVLSIDRYEQLLAAASATAPTTAPATTEDTK